MHNRQRFDITVQFECHLLNLQENAPELEGQACIQTIGIRYEKYTSTCKGNERNQQAKEQIRKDKRKTKSNITL